MSFITAAELRSYKFQVDVAAAEVKLIIASKKCKGGLAAKVREIKAMTQKIIDEMEGRSGPPGKEATVDRLKTSLQTTLTRYTALLGEDGAVQCGEKDADDYQVHTETPEWKVWSTKRR
jgi:hypothetical protein